MSIQGQAILIESAANPLLTVTDTGAVAALAKKHGILSIVDNLPIMKLPEPRYTMT